MSYNQSPGGSSTAPVGSAVPAAATTIMRPCRDFVNKRDDIQLWLWGLAPALNILEHYISNLRWNRLPTPGTNYMCALYALEISLKSAYELRFPGRPPRTFDELLIIYRSNEYEDRVRQQLASIPDGSPGAFAQYDAEYSELTRVDDLSVSALVIVLGLLSQIENEVFSLGVCTWQQLNDAGEDVYSAACYASIPNAQPTVDLWIVNDGAEKWAPKYGPYVVLSHFSGIGPDYDPPNLPNASGAAQGNSGRKRRNDSEEKNTSNKRPKKDRETREYRTQVANAPPRDTDLPYDELTDCTVEELIAHYPDHITSWPGLALLARQNIIQGGFVGIEKIINTTRGTHDNKSEEKSVIGSTLRKRLEKAIQQLLGPSYSIEKEKHNECIRERLGREKLTFEDFLNQHLWDKPQKLQSSLKPALPLREVAKLVSSTHMPQGNFSRRLQDAQTGQHIAPAPPTLARNQIHPLIINLPNAGTTLDPLDPTAARRPNTRLDRDVCPNDMEPEEVVLYKPDSLWGEPLLFAFKKLDLVAMSRILGGGGGKHCKILARLKHRKKAALQARAAREGVSYKEAFETFEKDKAGSGFKHHARRFRKEKPKDDDDMDIDGAVDADTSGVPPPHSPPLPATDGPQGNSPEQLSVTATAPGATTQDAVTVDPLSSGYVRTMYSGYVAPYQLPDPVTEPTMQLDDNGDDDMLIDPLLDQYQWTPQ